MIGRAMAVAVVAAGLLGGAGGVAFAAGAPGPGDGSGGAMSRGMAAPGQADAPVDRALAGGMATMNHQMAAAPLTGNPDRDFVSMMIPHHEGAVQMAEVEVRYGRDPQMRALARRIIAAQVREVGEMKRWEAAPP